MCKLLIVPKVNSSKQVTKFLKASIPFMTARDKDGVGYAAVGLSGEVFGERWLDPKHSFKGQAHKTVDIAERIAFKGMEQVLESKGLDDLNYTKFGTVSDRFTSIMLHSRMATSAKGMVNTHPFVDGDTVLIHNGVLTEWNIEDSPVQSSCDSEALLNAYTRNSVDLNPEALTEAVADLAGYYAAGVYSVDSQARVILDVIKDDAASLFAVYVPMLESAVFCTSPQIIKDTCRLLKWKVGAIRKIKDCSLIRFDAISGDVILTSEFTKAAPKVERASFSKGWDWTEDSLTVNEEIKREGQSFIEYESGRIVKK